MAQRALACCELERISDLVAEVSHEEGLVVVSRNLLLDIIDQAVTTCQFWLDLEVSMCKLTICRRC
jgi:hypothetical protein